jgi:hypothetical protein
MGFAPSASTASGEPVIVVLSDELRRDQFEAS